MRPLVLSRLRLHTCQSSVEIERRPLSFGPFSADLKLAYSIIQKWCSIGGTGTDANVPAAELEWLQSDLKSNKKPVIVFAHQRLDVRNSHGVKNNADVRKILESSSKVRAVFQGHSHQNDLKEINGIHYCTLVAMIEGSGHTNNGYSVLELESNGTIRLTGFRKQKSHKWSAVKRRSNSS